MPNDEFTRSDEGNLELPQEVYSPGSLWPSHHRSTPEVPSTAQDDPVVQQDVEEVVLPVEFPAEEDLAVQVDVDEDVPVEFESSATLTSVEEVDVEPAIVSEPAVEIQEVSPELPSAGETDETEAVTAVDVPRDDAPVVEEEVSVHTTTIPIATVEDIAQHVPEEIIPDDVLEARDPDNPPTSAIRRDLMTPQEDAPESAPAWEAAIVPPVTPVQSSVSGQTPESLDDAIFEGATVVPVVPSRAGAHIWSVLLGVVFIPLGWFFFADASARMLFPADAPVMTGQVSWLALGEFVTAVCIWLLFVLLTLRSSLGAWVWGTVLTICGLPWLIVPGHMQILAEPALGWLRNRGVVATNLAHHFELSAFSGRLLLMGLVLLTIATVAVSVRRRGRAEEALRAQVEKVNPEGAHLSSRARRRAAKKARRAQD